MLRVLAHRCLLGHPLVGDCLARVQALRVMAFATHRPSLLFASRFAPPLALVGLFLHRPLIGAGWHHRWCLTGLGRSPHVHPVGANPISLHPRTSHALPCRFRQRYGNTINR